MVLKAENKEKAKNDSIPLRATIPKERKRKCKSLDSTNFHSLLKFPKASKNFDYYKITCKQLNP